MILNFEYNFILIYFILWHEKLYILSNPYLIQGIGSVYVMADFICKGYLKQSGTQVER